MFENSLNLVDLTRKKLQKLSFWAIELLFDEPCAAEQMDGY